MKIKVQKLGMFTTLPTYATEGTGCFDIYADSRCDYIMENDSVVIDTGLSFEIPEGYVMLIFSRSGHGFNSNIRLANCVGVIDSDYRGELKVKLHRDTKSGVFGKYMRVEVGDRIAQGMVIPIPKVEFEEVKSLSNTNRGGGGFGSTGN